MNPAPGPADRGGIEDAASDPLGEVCDLLDVLAPSSAPAGLTSTTIEMAAVTAGAVTRGTGPARSAAGPLSRLLPPGVVLAALVGGFLAGRSVAPDPDGRMLEYLPVVEHLDVLQEAGSIGFLEEVAERDYPPPRRFPFGIGRGPDPRGDSPGDEGDDDEEELWPQLDDTITALQEGPFGPETPADQLAARRERVEDLGDDERRRLSDAVRAFQQMPLAVQHDVIQLARRLSEWHEEDSVDRLVAPARTWHQWLASRDPADRRAVVGLGTDDRLEWLDRYARRFARPQWPPGRGFPGRGGQPEGDRGAGSRGFREGGDRPGQPGRSSGDVDAARSAPPGPPPGGPEFSREGESASADTPPAAS